MIARRNERAQEMLEDTVGGAAFGGLVCGTAGYVLSNDAFCHHVPQLLNQTVTESSDAAALVSTLVTRSAPEIQRILSLNYLNTRGIHVPGYIQYEIFKDELGRFASAVSNEVFKYSYNLTQHTFTQECLNYLGPSALMKKYAWWGALAGAGLGLAIAISSYLQSDEPVAREDKKLPEPPRGAEETDEDIAEAEHAVASSHEIDRAVAEALEKQVPQLVEEAANKAVAVSLMRAETLFKRRQELLKMNKQYHESTNIHRTYGLSTAE